MLPAFLLFALSIGQPSPLKKTVKALRSFEVGGTPCELRVTDRDVPVTNEKITIACDHLTILTYDLGNGAILNIELVDPSKIDSVRMGVTLERGLTATLVIFETSKSHDKVTAKTVYEHSSQNVAELFEDGDVVLEHVQRRFEAGHHILPGGTNIYRWQDGKYFFIEGFRWSQAASWVDRYCILYKPESCPAERTKKRILDDYER